MKARLNLRDPFKTIIIPSAGSGSHVIPETLSSDTEAVSSIVEQDNSATDVLEVEQRNAMSHSSKESMHADFVPDLFAASVKTLASLEKQRALSDPFIEPITLCSSSIEPSPQLEEQINSQNHMARPSPGKDDASSPRFINPAKVIKSNNGKRYIGSYLNQHQLYMLHQQETRVVRKLETKSIPQLQMLQHKALTIHASNKIKNLIQDALFKKHMAEMKEWESQLDAWSKDYQNERARADNHEV
ncbi:hypothetical protein KCU95_g8781, partial [Aureobasidium melanogenum]